MSKYRLSKRAEQARKRVLEKYPHLRCFKDGLGGYELFSYRHGFRGKGKTREEAWLDGEQRLTKVD